MGSSWVQAAAGILCLFFAIAAAAKLDSWESWSQAVADWVPSWLPTPIVSVALPLAEAVTAVLLVISPVAGLVVSSLLLWSFGIAVLIITPAKGGQSCGCFGALMPDMIGRGLALRDFLIGAVAVISLVVSRRSDVEGLTIPQLLLLALAGTLLVLGFEAKRVFQLGSKVFSERAPVEEGSVE